MNAIADQIDVNAGPILLYDGVCGLCDSSVNFILNHDRDARFRFAPLQSGVAAQLLMPHHLNPDAINTMVLIHNGHAYTRSSGALHTLLLLGGGFAMLAEICLLIPEPVRDLAYNWISKNRYRWFGKHAACRMPAANLAKRFL